MSSAKENNDLLNSLEFVDERERLYFAQAQLGDEAVRFLQSPIGRYLHGRAKQQADECSAEALSCNPDSYFGRRKLVKLQKKSATALAFMSWCVDIITEGDLAGQELDNYRG